MTLLTLTFLTILVSLLIKFLCTRMPLYRLSLEVPGPTGLPFLGDILKFIGIKKSEFMDRAFSHMDPSSPLTKIWLGPKLILMTEDPDVIHTVFNSPSCLNKPEIFYSALSAVQGLLPLTGDLYPKHRKLLNRSFMPAILQKIHPIVDEKCKVLVKKLEVDLGREVNIMRYVGACALESFGKAQFDYTSDFYGSSDLKFVEDSMDLAMDRLTKPWFHFLPDFVFNFTKLGRDIQSVVDYGNKYRQKATEIYEDLKVKDHESIKNRVVDVLLDPSNGFSDIEIRDEFIIFVMGSYDTTAKTVSILLLMLAMHQDVQDKLIAEIDEICGQNDNLVIDVDFLKKFEYTELVLKETMRLFPSGPTVARTTSEDVEVGGYKVPKEAIFLISIMKLHRNPRHWGCDAHLFRPERFEDEKLNSRAFVPFSGGKRICIGNRYANMFIKTLLINFFRAYRVETSLKYEELVVLIGITIDIKQGFMVRVKKREIKCK